MGARRRSHHGGTPGPGGLLVRALGRTVTTRNLNGPPPAALPKGYQFRKKPLTPDLTREWADLAAWNRSVSHCGK
jgi:hypothetical protein